MPDTLMPPYNHHIYRSSRESIRINNADQIGSLSWSNASREVEVDPVSLFLHPSDEAALTNSQGHNTASGKSGPRGPVSVNINVLRPNRGTKDACEVGNCEDADVCCQDGGERDPPCCKTSKRSNEIDPQERLDKMMLRSCQTPSWKFRDPDSGLKKIDEYTAFDCPQSPEMYHGRLGKPSKYSELYEGACETADARSQKITCQCRVFIREIHELMGCLFERLSEVIDQIPNRDFSACSDILNLMQVFQETFMQMVNCLRYSPYEEDMLALNDGLIRLLEELEVQPAFVLVRMIEFGYFLYEIGRFVKEDFLPTSFVLLIHALQTRIYRLRTGRVVRQIFFVPSAYDPVVSTYYKSRQILRIENYCHCKIVLLPPEDPRSLNCPLNWRCLEVNFDEQRGRYLAFKKLLSEACPVPAKPIFSVASVFRRVNGIEADISPAELCTYEITTPRISVQSLASDIRTKHGLAVIPRLRMLEK